MASLFRNDLVRLSPGTRITIQRSGMRREMSIGKVKETVDIHIRLRVSLNKMADRNA